MKSKTADERMRQEIRNAIECNRQKVEEISLKHFNMSKPGGEWKTIETEPIISAGTFYKAQKALKKRNT